jgi:choice-of-anchor C domain-containing protein
MRIAICRLSSPTAAIGFLLCAALAVVSACSDDKDESPTAPSVSVVQIASSRSAALLNGSFEQGPAIPADDLVIAAGSKDLSGWNVTRGDVKYLGSSWNVPQGARAIDLDGTMPGEISQTFATTKNQTYVVSFYLSGNPEGALAKHLRVTVDGVAAEYFFNTSAQTKDVLTWQPINFSFVASGTSATLTFTSLSRADSASGALIDNVSVVQ